MKKVFSILSIAAVCFFATAVNLNAQQNNVTAQASEVLADSTAVAAADVAQDAPVAAGNESFHKALKTKFIEGGAGFMAIIVFCLIFGLALSIERILYLNINSVNTKKLLDEVDAAFTKGGAKEALEVCRNARGPVASIFYQGLSRYDEGIEVVEKSVASYGSVQLGLLEKNLSWIALFIDLAHMLGFMGTVIGMIQAFDNIQMAGDISPTIVAGGIKVALLTTVFGLIVAIILQIAYNYILSRIDALVGDMEDSSISLLDVVVKHTKK
jgi:biopolymer transport protein ExbB